MKKFFVPIVIIVTLVFGFCLLSSKLLRIRHVTCTTQFGPCPQFIWDKLSVFDRQPMYLGFPGDKFIKSIGGAPAVASISFQRRLPDNLIVNIKLHQPIGIISLSSTGLPGFLVAADGSFLGPAVESPLPVLVFSSVLPSHPDTITVSALRLLSQLTALLPPKITASLEGFSLTVTAPDSPLIILTANDSSGDWYSSLQLILNRSKISTKLPKIIDLRFTNPVLTY